jgi:hypothetical protein
MRSSRAGRGVASVLLLLTLGGCTVSTGPREPVSTKVKEVLDSGQGQFDLTRPPSREEVGMPAGASIVTYQREDHRPFHRIALPEDRKLELDTTLLTRST